MADRTGNEAKTSGEKEPISGFGSMVAPAITLPKGGGAIRGIAEKFAANPVTGTGTLSIPIDISPSRSGFGPQLSLTYDSGAGNGPFGLGWELSLPSITRKTDKGLPKYQDAEEEDAEESDVFLLSGAEDLVPALVETGGEWQRDSFRRVVDGVEYRILRYRPRIEGLFARIERWTGVASGETHWRSISKENITTLYGKTQESRIASPTDPLRVFSWLICESYDDKGNAILYQYSPENSIGIDLSQVHERNRTDLSRSTNRYIKRITYGNRTPHEHAENLALRTGWMFEVVFDYGEHDTDVPTPSASGQWLCRHDPFSSFRAGFEVRTYRLCQRALIFHHFPDEEGVGEDCLVRSIDFTYRSIRNNPDDLKKGHPLASFIASVTQRGYKRLPDGSYGKKSFPALEFEYSQATIQGEIREVDPESLANLPYGLDGSNYQWIDLDGEGVSGILTEQGGGWFYKRNLSPLNIQHSNGTETVTARFAPIEAVAQQPSLAALDNGRQQFLDLAGDGQIDLVQFSPPLSGFYERENQSWAPFVPFESAPTIAWDDPNLRFVDLTGDGHADVLITEHEVFTWYPSQDESGFGPARKVHQGQDEEQGPRLVFADGTQSIYLADMSGDGLSDLVRIENGEVCYWPNLGYGHFGAKVAMDEAPWFDTPDLFDHKRIRLADIDGSGVTDIIYLGPEGVCLYFNQSGNRWGGALPLTHFPPIDDLSAVTVIDLLGNGTACLVWSSPLPGAARRSMRYIDLMGGQKPNLLMRSVNNMGAETVVRYAPSTRFYLQDERDGRPWITKLPFPVHVLERVETYDHVNRNRFVSRYAYHHGYFDGVEREFRGFGMVEQWDTEEFAALRADDEFPPPANIDEASHVPPVHTKTWFHTGAYLDRDHISNFFAGAPGSEHTGEYYREPDLDDAQAGALLLEDTLLPVGLTAQEEREACRALKGSMLRQEIYAADGTDKQNHPYSLTEQNFTIRRVQPRADNRHAVFFTHPREAISYHYERNPADPRIAHALTLEVDEFGNVLKAAAIGYGRRQADMDLSPADRAKQSRLLATYTENNVTNTINADDDYRTPLPCETRTYELSGLVLPTGRNRFTFAEMLDAGITATPIAYEQHPTSGVLQKRLIEQTRTLYRHNDLSGALPLGVLQSLALPFENYKLAFTPGLAEQIYTDSAKLSPAALDTVLVSEGKYVHSESDDNWWIAAGQIFFSKTANIANPATTAVTELAEARQHFFLPRKFTDAFAHSSTVDYDTHDLLVAKSEDALGNTVAAGNDYRVLQPRQITDANGNRSEVTFDALGMVVGIAVMGKATGPVEGDSLAGFNPDLTPQEVGEYFDALEPRSLAVTHLGSATSRIVYDLNRVPACAATITRETHVSDLSPGAQPNIQLSFVYSDAFGREIQKKTQAEPGLVPERDADGQIILGPDGQPQMTPGNVSPRWVGSSWTVFNNKGKPVRQYEPFFTDTHRFEFDVRIGVSPVFFYDPAQRVIATLHPNHTWEKVVFDPWRQETWDVNDTVLLTDPGTDLDIGDFFLRLPDAEYLPTWHTRRQSGAMGAREQAAANQAGIHANTPGITHFDTLGRPFLTVASNRFERNSGIVEEKYTTRIHLDIEGNQREVLDANERIVMRRDYDMLGNRIHQASMEAGERWSLNNAMGNPLRQWDSRGHEFSMSYDELHRATHVRISSDGNIPILAQRLFYGEAHPNAVALNLRGKPYQQYDGAGAVTTEKYDFKGNLLISHRQLAIEYKEQVDWSILDALTDTEAIAAAATPLLEAEIFTAHTTFDALNRPLALITPDNSVTSPTYNEAGLLERMEISLHSAAAANIFIDNINYDAKGRRTFIEYGNGVRTEYAYDPDTLHLTNLKTERPTSFVAGERVVQNLFYTHDPIGNITHIRDDAQQTVFFRNHRVEPNTEYTYDAIYRLIEAKGREHLGQIRGAPTPHSHDDAPRVGLLHPGMGDAMGNYIESYFYDAVGNFQRMQHRGSDPSHAGWTRDYEYNEASLLEPFKKSNRLSSTSIGTQSNLPVIEPYTHDAHGNMTQMPHLPVMQWDAEDQLQATSRQVVNDGGTPETTYYVYDAGGQRVRKVTERQAAAGQTPTRRKERVYLGGFEVYREYQNDGETVTLERETLHIMDDQQRIALVETRTQGNDPAPEQLTRYQCGNHLGSASLETDAQAQIISYEEYYPYGGTSYHAVRSQTESPKRYRYTGKERDEENGLNYHEARYYAPWLGVWISCDPFGLEGGMNLYSYGAANPINFVDPSGKAPKKYQKQRAKDTIAKRKEMERNLAEAKKKGHTLDPMQKRAEKLAKKRNNRTPIEQHHHKGVKESAKVKLDPAAMGNPMSSVWSTKKDPKVQAGIGDKPVWDTDFEGKKKTHHNVAKHLDLDEQSKGPKTVQGLEDASKASKQRLPATADMTERAKMDWTRTQPVGPSVDPKTGRVMEAGASVAKAETKLVKEVTESAGKKLGKRATKMATGSVPGGSAAFSCATEVDCTTVSGFLYAASGEIGIGPVDLQLVIDLIDWMIDDYENGSVTRRDEMRNRVSGEMLIQELVERQADPLLIQEIEQNISGN